MTGKRILTIAHNHPGLHPGGTEIFAHNLFNALKAQDCQCLFLACTNQTHRERRPGTCFQTFGRSADEVILWAGHFDRFFQSQIDLHGLVPELADLLTAFKPDIVHVHHTLLLGVEMLFLIRRVLPAARLVYTLHDYYPICAHDGQMVTAGDLALCHGASPDACHRCFPDQPPDRFLLRERHLKTLFSLVDRFIAPSRFLRDRYIAWGLAPGRIEVVPNGRPAVAAAPFRALNGAERRASFGYFGNFNPFKGVSVALGAAARLAAAGETGFSLHLHGGAPFQTDAFKTQIAEAIAECGPVVTRHGPYRSDELPGLMAGIDWVIMPSVWWENAPLVIQEAFQHRRPVLCSGIGGMAEAVTHEVDGLHFRAGDPADLARVMRRALDEPDLWQRLSAGIAPVPTMAETAERHLALYDELDTTRRRSRSLAP